MVTGKFILNTLMILSLSAKLFKGRFYDMEHVARPTGKTLLDGYEEYSIRRKSAPDVGIYWLTTEEVSRLRKALRRQIDTEQGLKVHMFSVRCHRHDGKFAGPGNIEYVGTADDNDIFQYGVGVHRHPGGRSQDLRTLPVFVLVEAIGVQTAWQAALGAYHNYTTALTRTVGVDPAAP